MAQSLRGRRLASIPEIGQEELGWMAIGFSLAVICLGLGCILFRLVHFCCERRRRVPHKITASPPDLPIGETRSESEEESSRLATFLQNQRPAPDATSDVSQSDVWSFSLKSFAADTNAFIPRDDQDEDDGNRSDFDDATFDGTLYTTTMESVAKPLPSRDGPVEKPIAPRSTRRFGAPVEI